MVFSSFSSESRSPRETWKSSWKHSSYLCRSYTGPRVMVGEPCSRKGTFCPDRHPADLSGLHLASPRFSKNYCPDLQYLAYFFARNLWVKSLYIEKMISVRTFDLAVSKNFSNLSGFAPGRFRFFYKIRPDW